MPINEAFPCTTSSQAALEAIDDLSLRAPRDRLLDIFFGDHGDLTIAKLKSRIRTSKLVLESLRPSKDIRYAVGEPGMIMGTCSVDDEPPRYVTEENEELQLHPSPWEKYDLPYLMLAFASGIKSLEALTKSSYPEALRNTLLHESFHVTNRDPFDLYARHDRAGLVVSSVVLHAAHEIKSKGIKEVPESLLRKTFLQHQTMTENRTLERSFHPRGGRSEQARIECAWHDFGTREKVLRDILDNFSPYMADNPDSYKLVIDGLSMLEKNRSSLNRFFKDYDQFLTDDSNILV
ncbi:hypothetical protein [Caballeronia sp. LZ043]|uniref:hypothetical protein n=3 Tax=unclassified Caballeronia TaxID=2646786 RepID=UPI00285467C4|nr:hypothetical protein [Caballeronia sp. LZ043]MDR5825427.1 hypothetical protein [Caballeronia sp. LZ043]